MTARAIEVDAVRLLRWVDGFGERHGGVVATSWDGACLVLDAGDGARALVDPVFPPGAAPRDAAAVAADAVVPRTVAVLLARRGGYACARVAGERVAVSKAGTRRVQSRTAAGGWSQQRYARRRANQADDLVDALVEHAARLEVGAGAAWLVTGGDRPLIEQALADPRLRGLAGLPRGRHLTVADPSGTLVAKLPAMLRSVQVRLSEP